MNSEIIELIKERLEKGQKEYGGDLDPEDGRDWEVETLEEILDGMIYLAAALLKKIKSDCKLINILSEKKLVQGETRKGIQDDIEC